jgi:cytochrome c
MLDTMTFTKVLGGFCGALLVFLLGGWAGEALFHTGGGHGGSEQAYLIETGDDDAPAEDEAEVDFAALVLDAEISDGERVFSKCKACHKVDGTDGVGPHLNGVVGREIASIGGFGYSDALAGLAGEAWTAENLNAFLADPKGWAPGTKMSFAGLNKVDDRADLVAYLQATDG